MVVGYPRIFNGTDCNALTWFSPTEESRLNSTADLLDSTLAARGEPAFRGRQIWEWVARGAASYAEMTNLPADLRAALEELQARHPEV